jgi:hypothetical protein
MGRQLIKEEAAYTQEQNEAEGSFPVKGVRGALVFCTKNAEGALARLPLEIIKKIEKVQHDTVCLLGQHSEWAMILPPSSLSQRPLMNAYSKQTFKRSDLPSGTRDRPGGFYMNSITGR